MPSIDRYVTPLKLPMAIDAFWRFPHLPAYKAEYLDGHAVLNYQPRLNMSRLAVVPRVERTPTGVTIAPIHLAGSHEAVAKLFVAAFTRVPPVDAMPATTRRHAADAAIRHTASGGDGELFQPACLAATDSRDGQLLGVALVNRISLRADEWPGSPLPDKLVNLTWLFVQPQRQRQQIATALADRVVNVLAEFELPWLVSHFSVDNSPAVMWHWRYGFELVGKVAG